MSRPKTAVIVGVSSQDGSYLAEFLLDKGYKVVGTIRRTTSLVHENIEHLKGKIVLEAADLIDQESLNRIMIKYQPDEVYNIASQSVPADAWSHPFYTGEVTALGPVRVFDCDVFCCFHLIPPRFFCCLVMVLDGFLLLFSGGDGWRNFAVP